MPQTESLGRRAAAEGAGTAFLLACVVGSGIMGQRLAAGNDAVALLANSLATVGGLGALIAALGPVSGAHFNPLVTVLLAWRGDLPWRYAPAYVLAQLAGAPLGVMAANLMFGLPAVTLSMHVRTGAAQWLSEGIATFGLLGVIWVCSLRRPGAVPAAVAGYVGAGYWFTASTCFANPAVSLARALTDTFAGIRPEDVGGFLVAQAAGALLAALSLRWLVPARFTGSPRK